MVNASRKTSVRRFFQARANGRFGERFSLAKVRLFLSGDAGHPS
jgi:hypothetical protein